MDSKAKKPLVPTGLRLPLVRAYKTRAGERVTLIPWSDKKGVAMGRFEFREKGRLYDTEIGWVLNSKGDDRDDIVAEW